MDVKWLFIGFFAVLGVFRALKPEVFSKWIRLQWEDLSDSRGRLSAAVVSLLLPAALFFVLGEALELKLMWWEAPLVITFILCLLYTSPSPRDGLLSRMPSSA